MWGGGVGITTEMMTVEMQGQGKWASYIIGYPFQEPISLFDDLYKDIMVRQQAGTISGIILINGK